MNKLVLLSMGVVVGSVLVTSTLSPVGASVLPVDGQSRATPHRVDEWGKQVVAMPLCSTSRDLDCIESVRVRTGGRWVEPTLISSERVSWVDPNMGPGEGFSSEWAYQAESGETVNFFIDSSVEPRGTTFRGQDRLSHGVSIHIGRSADEEHPFISDPALLDCSSGVVDECILFGPRLPPSDFFRVTARTSWLRDNGAGINGLDMSMSSRPIEGGTWWSFGARQVLVPHPKRWDEVTPAQGWVPRLSFQVDHAGAGLHDSAFDPRCADAGAPWKSINSAGSGRLKWSKSRQTVDFQIFSPHLDPHGRPFIGDFTAVIPLKWLRCFAGKRLNPASFSVQVVNEDGEEKVATTSLSVKRGWVHVRATGFTFSRPTIQLSTRRGR